MLDIGAVRELGKLDASILESTLLEMLFKRDYENKTLPENVQVMIDINKNR